MADFVAICAPGAPAPFVPQKSGNKALSALADSLGALLCVLVCRCYLLEVCRVRWQCANVRHTLGINSILIFTALPEMFPAHNLKRPSALKS